MRVFFIFGLLTSNQGSENAGKFLAVDTDGSIKYEDAPEAAQLEARVETLEGQMNDLILDSTSTVNYIDLDQTVIIDNTYINASGEPSYSAEWKYYKVPVENALTVTYKCYQGGQQALPMVAFYNSTTISSGTYISGDNNGGTIRNDYITNTVDVPEGTKCIVFNTKFAVGGTPEGTGLVGVRGVIPEMQDEINNIISELEQLAGKSVKEGLRIAVTGDSISTSTVSRAPEIEITEEDIGVQLGGWLTTYDFQRHGDPYTIAGVTYTSADIGKYITFVPTAADVGKTVGNESIYNGVGTKVWWEWFQDLGVDTINGTYSSGSMDSHEASVERLKTAHGWHDQQIRRLGKRIPGTMQRQAPDIILMYRGCNDMTHSPYAKLTANYFSGLNWTYPDTDVIASGYGFKEACSVWVKKLRKVYPRAQIVFCTQNGWKRINYSHFPVNNGDYTQPQFNAAIREIADFFGCETVDFDKDGITYENMYPTYISDSSVIPTHPNNLGHATMGVKAIKDLDAKLDLFNFTPLMLNGLVDHHIIANLTNATISNTSMVYTGESFTATLTPEGAYAIGSATITMGGVDITSTAWNSSTNTISIASVNGDVIITNTVVIPEQVNLTKTFTNVTCDVEGDKLAKNQAASIKLTADNGYYLGTVAVTMGGVDITDSCYSFRANNAFVNIANVTDDVTITASGIYFNSAYKAVQYISGVANQSVNTGLQPADIGRNVTKFEIATRSSSTGYGVWADIFCNDDGNNFSSGASSQTGLVPVAGTTYNVELSDVNQQTSYLKIYAGDDDNLTTVLGQASRASLASTTYFGLLGFAYGASAAYSCLNHKFYYSRMYDTSNQLSHYYIPVRMLTTDEKGLYDLIGNKFLPFTAYDAPYATHDVTQTLTNVTSSYTSNKVLEGTSFDVVLTADAGYMIDSVTVTMGVTDVTAESYTYYANGATIHLDSVTDDVTIIASATLVSADYVILKELQGQERSVISTGLNANSSGLKTAIVRFYSISPLHNKGFGCYGKIFCNEYMDPVSDRIEFCVGNPANSGMSTEVEAEQDKGYIAKMNNIHQGLSTLEMFAGTDLTMTTRLGDQASRDSSSTTVAFGLLGFIGAGAEADYSCNNQTFQEAWMYDSSDTLVRHYVPAQRVSDSAYGVYDLVNNTFTGFTNLAA